MGDSFQFLIPKCTSLHPLLWPIMNPRDHLVYINMAAAIGDAKHMKVIFKAYIYHCMDMFNSMAPGSGPNLL